MEFQGVTTKIEQNLKNCHNYEILRILFTFLRLLISNLNPGTLKDSATRIQENHGPAFFKRAPVILHDYDESADI